MTVYVEVLACSWYVGRQWGTVGDSNYHIPRIDSYLLLHHSSLIVGQNGANVLSPHNKMRCEMWNIEWIWMSLVTDAPFSNKLKGAGAGRDRNDINYWIHIVFLNKHLWKITSGFSLSCLSYHSNHVTHPYIHIACHTSINTHHLMSHFRTYTSYHTPLHTSCYTFLHTHHITHVYTHITCITWIHTSHITHPY